MKEEIREEIREVLFKFDKEANKNVWNYENVVNNTTSLILALISESYILRSDVEKAISESPVVLVNISMSGVHGSEIYKHAILVDELKKKLSEVGK